MIIIKSERFFKWFTGKWVRGIAIYPFIFYKHKELRKNKAFINHESIHIRQQFELLILPFYIWYFVEYGIRLIQYKGNQNEAYLNISFEREAYANEDNLDYLKNRKFWSFTLYL